MARMPEKSCLPLRENAPGTSLIVLTIALLAIGVVMVKSSMSSLRPVTLSWLAQGSNQHVLLAIAAALILCVAWRLDYHHLAGKTSLPLGFPLPALILLVLAVGAGALVLVPGIGHKVGDYARWIRLGPVSIQPSELIKLTLLVFLAAWLSGDKVNVKSWETFLLAFVVIGLSVGVIVTQDFGTAAVIGLSAVVLLLLAGVPWYFVISAAVPVAAGVFWLLVIKEPYRMQRMMTHRDPWSSYQTTMSLNAIFSGGWTGMGLGNGIMKMGYLPDAAPTTSSRSSARSWAWWGPAWCWAF